MDEWDDNEEYLQDDGTLWRVCWQCGGEGVSDHDCGEDCCACLYPEDNVRCDICEGKGGWVVPPKCATAGCEASARIDGHCETHASRENSDV